MSKDKIDESCFHDLEVMNNSATYLTKLVNELLDYIRIEKMGFTLKCEDINITERLKSVIFNFSDTIRNNNLNLNYEPLDVDIIVSADSSALDKILNNIILNAVKYAETNICIKISYDSEHVKIYFSNDGALIPTEFRTDIFKPFVQYRQSGSLYSKSGVGIGLPLSKNLAKMHSGDLVLSDDLDQTCFILSLPIKSYIVHKNNELNISEEKENEYKDASDDVINILITDDNKEFREYLASKLSNIYNILMAENGHQAFELLKEQNVDMLITDISMPEMTGLELCEAIRKDIELSHTPIIIISARGSIESKIQAMESGADLYVEKPFDMEYLLSSIKNILDKRILLKNAINKGLMKTEIDIFGLPKKDEAFLAKFNQLIKDNISNDKMSNEFIAQELGMSLSTFTRKIKKLLNTSPNTYIKTLRLSVAAEMLKDSHGNNITDIGYSVGFSNVSYFTKCFKEQYGMTPSEWVSRL